MRRRHLISWLFTVVFVVVLLPLPVWATGCLQGNGLPGKQSRTLADFERIVVQGAFTVQVRIGAETSCLVRGDNNLLDEVATLVDDGELLIAPRTALGLKQPLVVEVQTPILTAIHAEGAHVVEVDGVMSSALELVFNGACRGIVRGEVSLLDAEMYGVSTLEAQDLICCDASITANGTTVTQLQVKKSLSVHASGIAEILYRGEPELTEVVLTGRAAVVPLTQPAE
jgi:hypothetical protein